MMNVVRSLIGPAIARYLNNKAEARLKGNSALWVDLHEYLMRTESTGCSYSDLATLYEHVLRCRPKHVLELGTGLSTVVIAHALKLIGEGGLVTSMEENEKYHSMAAELFPSDLKKFADIRLSPAIEKTRDFFRGSGYKDIPHLPYEFVFVDGPSYLSNPKGEHLGFNFDLIEVLERAEQPVAALIDSRHSTCYVYRQILGDRVRYDYLRKLGMVLPSTKKDLRSGRKIVASAMEKHSVKRPSLMSLVSGLYW